MLRCRMMISEVSILIKLTSFYTGEDIYVNANRISVIESIKTDNGTVKTRVACPKPVYAKETPEEIVEIINNGILNHTFIAWDPSEHENTALL